MLRTILTASGTESLNQRREILDLKQEVERLQRVEFSEADIRELTKVQRKVIEKLSLIGTSQGVGIHSTLEAKLLELQMMLPELASRWQAGRTIHLSQGTQTQIIMKTVATSVAEDRKDVQRAGVSIDPLGEIEDEVWTAMPRSRRKRITRKRRLAKEYDPFRPQMRFDLTEDSGDEPPPPPPIQVSREGGSIAERLTQIFQAELEATSSNKPSTLKGSNYELWKKKKDAAL